MNMHRKLQKDELIFDEGSVGAEAYIVLSGSVDLWKGSGASARMIANVGPGQIFGELAIIAATPRAASAIASNDDTAVLAMNSGQFMHLVAQQPAFSLIIMETMSRWMGNGPPEGRSSATAALSRGAVPHVSYSTVPLSETMTMFRSRSRSCNAYLFRGRDRVVLVDPGLVSSFASLAVCFPQLGLTIDDIDTVVLTHEHFDHFAATPLVRARKSVMAHRLAAHKLAQQDEFALMSDCFSESAEPFEVTATLAEGDVIDTGNHKLEVIHTPGHSSGSISLFDPDSGALVCGDLVLGGGNMGGIFGSGNASDSICSLKDIMRRPVTRLLPGHGGLSENPIGDIERVLQKLQAVLADTRSAFHALNGQENLNRLVLAVRDLNR